MPNKKQIEAILFAKRVASINQATEILESIFEVQPENEELLSQYQTLHQALAETMSAEAKYLSSL